MSVLVKIFKIFGDVLLNYIQNRKNKKISLEFISIYLLKLWFEPVE